MDYFFDWDKAGDAHMGIEPIFTADEIVAKVDELAGRLTRWFDTEPVAQVVMNGAVMFAADLTRAMSMRGCVMEMDFIHVLKSRQKSTAQLAAASDLPVKGRDVLVIDDIFENGRTLSFVRDHFLSLGAESVTSVVLLDKSGKHTPNIKPDFVGFECPDVFVIGYGMDIAYKYRELPFIGKMGRA
jgi:hypoxanthine phosphoribosyltransferase